MRVCYCGPCGAGEQILCVLDRALAGLHPSIKKLGSTTLLPPCSSLWFEVFAAVASTAKIARSFSRAKHGNVAQKSTNSWRRLPDLCKNCQQPVCEICGEGYKGGKRRNASTRKMKTCAQLVCHDRVCNYLHVCTCFKICHLILKVLARIPPSLQKVEAQMLPN